MKYRELLNKCKSQPGWLASKEQRKKQAYAKYINWVEKQNEEYLKYKKDDDEFYEEEEYQNNKKDDDKFYDDFEY